MSTIIALINNPKIIFADEPTGNLDSKNSLNVFELFKTFANKGTTIIVATHDKSLAALANKIYEVKDGKYYPILRAVPGEKENLKAEELFYGPRLLEKENPVLREYLLKQQEQNQTLIRQLSDHSSEKAAQRLWELKEKEAVLESALARFHTM